MTGLLTILSSLGTIAIIFLFTILARLSEKLGAVTRIPRYYLWFLVGQAFLMIALVAQLLRISMSLTDQAALAWLQTSEFYLITYHLPMAVGVTIGLIVTWRYWSWLLTEHG